ncbi:MAG: DUF5681 domain-containing protein [Pirellulaceae bacterium]|nr:DUF5681 domain-containing protein [Pirellulaceae bacterium]
MSNDSKVGYRNPPKRTRFKKGQSGNPKGRPKGTRNLKTDLRDELDTKISVREGNRQIKVSKQQALVKSQLAKAIKGDTKAAAMVINAIFRLFETEPFDESDASLTADERAIVETIQQRLQKQDPRPENVDPQRHKKKRRRHRLRLNND